jgi:thioredoxin 1
MIKKVLSWLLFVVFSGLVILGFSYKSHFNQYASHMMQNQITPELKESGSQLIDSLYNHSKNSKNYQLTFLEFGSTGCSACRKMEKIMEETEAKYGADVQVVFHNVSEEQSLNLMKYYGIVSIPTQVFLDKQGKEIFRHSGFISFDDIEERVFRNIL